MDIRLIKALERSPRASYGDLSKHLGISPSSVQRRLTNLESSGLIRGYSTTLVPNALGGSMMVIHGQADGPVSKGADQAIREQGSVHRAIYGCHSHLYLIVFSRSSAEVGHLMDILQDECGMADPDALFVSEHFFIGPVMEGLFSSQPLRTDPAALSDVDFMIIDSLCQDARRPLNDICRDIGCTPRLVRKRLALLMGSGLLSFEVEHFPRFTQDIMFLMRVQVRSRTHRHAFLDRLSGLNLENLDEVAAFDNSPRLLFVDGLTTSVEELNAVVERLASFPEVERVLPEVSLNVHSYETWVEREVRKRAVRARQRRSGV